LLLIDLEEVVMKILGIDEAGRGCVLGPLVVGAFCCDESKLEELAASGATDSKKLSAKKRNAILEKLPEIGSFHKVEISPFQIDNGNINTLEEEAFVQLILHFRPDKVYIDAPTHPAGIPAFVRRLDQTLSLTLEKRPSYVVEPKADLNYPIVGAASIVAKVNRDAHIKPLNAGSGYPSDPKTRAWLRGFFEREEELPESVRTRWGTIALIQEEVIKANRSNS
jgi:ribonuclease HII